MSVLLASLVAVAGLWYSNLQTRQANEQARDERALTKEGQITDRYTAAVGNLGDDKMDVRMGGIYALQRIMQDSPRDHPTIGNVLAAYVRTHAAIPGTKEKRQEEDVPADIHAALTVLITRETAHDKSFVLDLQSVWLPNAEISGATPWKFAITPQVRPNAALAQANLTGAHLPRAVLHAADLSGAAMESIVLRGADLSRANLSHASLSDADLSGVELSNANLSRARMVGADLSGVTLDNTDLTDADLRDSNLSGTRFLFVADFPDINMRGADLSSANLTDAYLSDVNLTGVNLAGAVLSRADLSGADLSGTYLSDADLRDSDLRGANLRGADLSDSGMPGQDPRGADLRGADLRGVKNLTREQIKESRMDHTTKLPADMS
ncbi:pentapeptide repeat-containing protein [Streptomyces niveus]|uniref:pentapeptide repeat-containing protein n=1 Tax=Streptomyces niveus TaxID=193462 RepID=UPI00365C88CB